MTGPLDEYPTDSRQWVRVSTDLFTNRKFMAISDPTAAIAAFVVSLCVSAQSQADGVFSIPLVQRITGISDTVVKEMIAEDLWHDMDSVCSRCTPPRRGHGSVHDYLLHQRSSEKQRELTEAKRRAGQAGADARWGKKRAKEEKARSKQPIASATETPSVAGEGRRPEVEMLCNGLANWIALNDSQKRRPSVGDAWYTDMRRMIDIDGYKVEDLKAVIDWSQRHPFWKINVKSPNKLRKQLKGENDLMGRMLAEQAGKQFAGGPARVQGTLVFDDQDNEFDRQARAGGGE